VEVPHFLLLIFQLRQGIPLLLNWFLVLPRVDFFAPLPILIVRSLLRVA
jgi:hypothetical protein